MAYVGGRIITMTSSGVIEKGAILTDGSKIEFVGSLGEAVIPAGYEMVDVVGKTIIPGLVDVHRHWNSYDPGNYEVAEVAPRYHLFANAAYGVTTVYDPQISTVEASYLSEISDSDTYNGSSFYASGMGHHGDAGHTISSRIESYDDALRLVKRMSLFRSPAIKDYLQPSRERRRWLAEAARNSGIGIVAHERNDLRTQLTLVIDGFTGIEHEMLMGQDKFYGDVRHLLVESQISITPTLADSGGANPLRLGRVVGMTKRNERFECVAEDPTGKDISDWIGIVERSGEFGSNAADSSVVEYAKLLREGAMITIGAHDLPQGIGSHWEMWLLALGGATPIDVLRAATVNGAAKLNLQDRIGSLAKGMDADFVILNSNPLESVYNTDDISRVIRRGTTVTWPSGSLWPRSWPVRGDWARCQGLGLEAVSR